MNTPMNTNMSTRFALAALLAGASLVCSTQASAHGRVQWSVTVGTPTYVQPGVVVYPQPNYIYGPPPSAFAPPPQVIYVQPPPVYRVYPPPVQYVDPYGQPLVPFRRHDHRDRHNHEWRHDRHDDQPGRFRR